MQEVDARVVAGTVFGSDRKWALKAWDGAIIGQTARPFMRQVFFDYSPASRPEYSIKRLADLRNDLIFLCLEKCPTLTHIFLCDSDIIPDEDVLEKLLEANKPIVAAVVKNSDESGTDYNFFHDELCRDGTEHLSVEYLKEPFRVTMTGACCLYRRDALDAGLRFEDHPQGEDCGLALKAKELGIDMWVHPLARTYHFMIPPYR